MKWIVASLEITSPASMSRLATPKRPRAASYLISTASLKQGTFLWNFERVSRAGTETEINDVLYYCAYAHTFLTRLPSLLDELWLLLLISSLISFKAGVSAEADSHMTKASLASSFSPKLMQHLEEAANKNWSSLLVCEEKKQANLNFLSKSLAGLEWPPIFKAKLISAKASEHRSNLTRAADLNNTYTSKHV